MLHAVKLFIDLLKNTEKFENLFIKLLNRRLYRSSSSVHDALDIVVLFKVKNEEENLAFIATVINNVIC